MVGIERDIQYYLQKIADGEGLSYKEAARRLSAGEMDAFRMSLDEYIRKGSGALDDATIHELERAASMYEINRLQAMALDMRRNVDDLYDTYMDKTTHFLATTYEEDFYRSIYALQAADKTFRPIQRVNRAYLDKILERPWTADGRTFSDRIWADQNKLISELERELVQSCIRGDSIKECSRRLAGRMDTSLYNARRLLHTENAHFSNQANADAWKGGSEGYELLATLDLRTSEICREMDRKKFKWEEKLDGVTYPPFHPHCRTKAIPYTGSEIEKEIDEEVGRMARDLSTGKSKIGPNMDYKTWYNRYVKEREESSFSDRPNRYVADKIARGDYGTVINPEKQKPHMQSTAKRGKSYLFDDVDPQELFDTYAGTGIMELDRNGNYTNKERCVAVFDIGVDGTSKLVTKHFKIHHSKKRTHISPYMNREEV